jgi:hypothetical protein
MATLATAKAKWARKMSRIGPVWKSRAEAGTANYCPEFAKFIGAPIKSEICSAQAEGVRAISAADFQAAVAGKEDKWERNLKAKVSG